MRQPREVLFEIVHNGPVAKVTAIDADTGLEATIQGPVSAGPGVLKQNALKKLLYLMSKKKKDKN